MRRFLNTVAVLLTLASPSYARPLDNATHLGWVEQKELHCEATSDHLCQTVGNEGRAPFKNVYNGMSGVMSAT
jgi:hypothetical protein